ncbi:adenine phosphoribosyltransferase [Salegentibacter echinorum]|uniref:Adenine phosphoribosyltransferase n=1 Tax=Salegentibacter echinorum TaxID=1073325 RepID=A0A1M5LX56_SALEC|nr:adenine phosphoribosyltransferase [Salegentibacter echinorum]SHG69684.1 adenine phosphoribosyltransferase [Salegentibacter echinorum]
MKNLDQYIREIPDFPKKGISYKDITPVLQNPQAMRLAVKLFLEKLGGQKIDKVVGIESRGFFFAALLAQKLDAGLVPIRKSGKLPYTTLKEVYELEYGKDVLEIHEDAIMEGENVLIHDDVLATGGTAAAACNLVRKLGGNIVQCNFLLELKFLNGRARIGSYDTVSLVTK